MPALQIPHLQQLPRREPSGLGRKTGPKSSRRVILGQEGYTQWATEGAEGTMSQTQVLVVDDDADIRRLLSNLLTRKGYAVHLAADAAEGMRLVGSAAPDVVLLDLNLPDKSGLDILRSIRAAAEMICVIVITGEHSVERAVAALKQGADNFKIGRAHV